MSVALVLMLVAGQTPATPLVIGGAASRWRQELTFLFHSGGWAATLLGFVKGQGTPGAARQEGQSERDARAARIQILQDDVTLQVGEMMTFVAVTYDQNDVPIGGVKYNWSASQSRRGGAARISENGDFEADEAGEYRVTVEGAGLSRQINVRVVGGDSLRWRREHNSSGEGTPQIIKSKRVSSDRVPAAVRSPQAHEIEDPIKPKARGQAEFTKASYTPPARPTAASPAAPSMMQGDPFGWNSNNLYTADDPDNERGDPPQHSTFNANSRSFGLAAPILSLSGRGTDLDLNLTYNSRLWNKKESETAPEIAFDIDKDAPAPGWSLGFGKMVNLGIDGAMLISADGTRHGFDGDVHVLGQSLSFIGNTDDGTFISYKCETNSFGVSGKDFGVAKYPDGTVVWYEGGVAASGERILHPTRIQDSSGNLVTVVRDNNKPDRPITTIVDTLGRVITFHYDLNNLLTAVTAAGVPDGNGGATTRTLVRLHYKPLFLDYDFAAAITPKVRDRNIFVIDAVYYPATDTGYWFGDQDSYSSYGMLAKVVEQRGMSFSASSLNEQGTVTPGSMTRQTVYNYPLTKEAGGTLSDAPGYTTATETWEGMDAGPAVTHYSLEHEPAVRKLSVTRPDNTRTVQYTHHAPDSELDGLLFKEEVYSAGDALLLRCVTEYQTGLTDLPPRAQFLEVTDELGQKVKTVYEYGPRFNEVAEVREYDHEGSLIRRTKKTYLNDPLLGYTSSGHGVEHGVKAPHNPTYNHPRLLHLVGTEEIYSGLAATTLIAKTTYRYDEEDADPIDPIPGSPPNCFPACFFEYTGYLVNTPNVTQHNFWFNPHGGVRLIIDGIWWPQKRGNLTSIVSYPDAKNPNSAVTRTLRYDVTGNAVSGTGGGVDVALTYNVNTQYAYPTARTIGSSGVTSRVSAGYTYDFNTGLQKSTTDANGRTSFAEYSPLTWRPTRSEIATGAYTVYEFDDDNMSHTETTYDEGDEIAAKSIKRLNGRGQMYRYEALAAGNEWDVAETEFDKLGRVLKQTRPFREGTPASERQWADHVYDSLGRVVRSNLPDGSFTRVLYNEPGPRPEGASTKPGKTIKAIDAWGRERWARVDSEGRVVEVVEPRHDGDGTVASGGQATTYKYDTLGNLVEVKQGAQTRSFKYDSLSRLTHAKHAEVGATLDDTGHLVAAGVWGEVFTYDERSNMATRVDARGVKTVFSYSTDNVPDPLNRLMSVSYDTQGAPGVLSTQTATFAYEPAGDVTRLRSLTVAEVGAEEFEYEAEGRLQHKKLTFSHRPDLPLKVSYVYDSLNRVTDIVYPVQYGTVGELRKTVHQDYDVASRLLGLTVDGTSYAEQITYNENSQTTSLLVGTPGANRKRESYQYDPETGLLTQQQVFQGEQRLLDLTYDYLRPGTTTGRTGQLTKVTDNLDPLRGRTYAYDALGRLAQAKGGDPDATALWTQTYSYDRYGNRETVTATGHTAGLNDPMGTKNSVPAVEVAQNILPPIPGYLRGEEKRRGVSDSSVSFAMPSPGPLDTLAGATLVDAPTNLRVTGANASQITLAWTAAPDAINYRVERGTSLSGSYTLAGTSASNGFADAGMTAGAAYLYRVCAADGAGDCVSPYSNLALGTAYTFADDPIRTMADDPTGATVTRVKALHITQLREAVNAVRALVPGLDPASWTNPTLNPQQSLVMADDVRDLRARLGEALSALGITEPSYTDATLSGWQQSGQSATPIKKEHIRQLRLASTRGTLTTSGGPTGVPVPTDGHTSLSYDPATNRINTPGWEYDAAGNQTRAMVAPGVWLRYDYDAAGRLRRIKDDNQQTVASYLYGYTNQRLMTQHGNESSVNRTYYVWGSSGVLAEHYEDAARPQSLAWAKSYVYLSTTLLATHAASASGDVVEFHDPDRLGTRVISNQAANTHQQQVTLPFGTALDAESTGASNRRFTSYDRSQDAPIDYAHNRFYDWQQGRFTQPDPIRMSSVSLINPQSFNLFSYCGNDPINFTDPGGLDGVTVVLFPGLPGFGGGGIGGFLGGLLGSLAGLFNFGLGLLGWLIQRTPASPNAGPRVASVLFPLPQQGQRGAQGGHVPAHRVSHPSAALYGIYDTKKYSQGDNEAFAARARQFAGSGMTAAFTSGRGLLEQGNLLMLRRPGMRLGRLAIFFHGTPPGIVGSTSNQEGLYIEDPQSLVYNDSRPKLDVYTYSSYFDNNGKLKRSDAASAGAFAHAILGGTINIAEGGEIIFYGCYSDALAFHVQTLLRTGRPDIRVTGAMGQVSMAGADATSYATWITLSGDRKNPKIDVFKGRKPYK